jgi:toxin-antitoxin system PIN domain toxin
LIVIDANVLLYTYDETSPFHSKCRDWLQREFTGNSQIALPWITLWAFVRISTNHRIARSPLDPAEAFKLTRQWLSLPGVVAIQPGPRHGEILERLVLKHQAAGPLLSDAALAAIAIEHGAELASVDQDFARFKELRWVNPLE